MKLSECVSAKTKIGVSSERLGSKEISPSASSRSLLPSLLKALEMQTTLVYKRSIEDPAVTARRPSHMACRLAPLMLILLWF